MKIKFHSISFFEMYLIVQNKVYLKNFFKVQFLCFKGQKLHFRRTSNNKHIKVNPATTQEEIAVQINKSLRTVKTYMVAMQKKGLIERKNGKKNGEWTVNV